MRGTEPELDYTTEIEVRYTDIDTQRVVNDGNSVHYLTEARVRCFEDVLGIVAEEVQDVVVAHLEIDFLRSVERDDDVGVPLGCTAVGSSSFTIEYELRVDDSPAVHAVTDHVTVDPSTGGSRPVPSDLRESLS